MSITLRKWSIEDLNDIWEDFIDSKIYNYFGEEYINQFNSPISIPCPGQDCNGKINKIDYKGLHVEGSESGYSWNVYHLDKNLQNNDIENLIPLHPWCSM